MNLPNDKDFLARCSCCSRSYDPITGNGEDTGLGKHPIVCNWADSPGWGVICNDCGVGVEYASTKDEAIKEWNRSMLSQVPPERMEPLEKIECEDDIPF
jgi:hypothetical protein